MTQFQCGDPNGTRTRVFAVKGEKPYKSTFRPLFHDSFRTLFINDLRVRGDVIPPPLPRLHRAISVGRGS